MQSVTETFLNALPQIVVQSNFYWVGPERPCGLQAANVDATLARQRRRLQRQEELERAKANASLSVKTEPMDADYKPDKLASGQLPGEEAAQEVHQMAAQLVQVQPSQPTACNAWCYTITSAPCALLMFMSTFSA